MRIDKSNHPRDSGFGEDDFFYGFSKREVVDGDYARYATKNRDSKLHDYPSCADEEFNKAQTIFGSRRKGIGYDCSDRLHQWDYKKDEAARNVAKGKFRYRTANFYEAYLCAYHGKPVKLWHIMAGCNVATGYPYLVFGYEFVTEKAPVTP